MKRLFFLTASLLFVAGTLSAQSLSELETKFTEAAAAMKAKNFAQAISLFEVVIDEGLDTEGADEFVKGAKNYIPTAYFYSGGGKFQKNDLDGAFSDFSRAAETAELYGNVSVLNNAKAWLGKTVMKQGADAFNNKDYVTAAGVFAKGYEANPNDTAVALNLAMSYSEMGEYEKGNEVYKNIIALAGQHSSYDAAVAEAREKYLQYNLLRASQNAQQKKYDDAIAAANEVLVVFPDNAVAQMLVLQTLNSKKDYSRMIEIGDAVIAAQTDANQKATANFLVAAAHQNKENVAQAIEYYRNVTAGQYIDTAKAQIVELQKVTKK